MILFEMIYYQAFFIFGASYGLADISFATRRRKRIRVPKIDVLLAITEIVLLHFLQCTILYGKDGTGVTGLI